MSDTRRLGRTAAVLLGSAALAVLLVLARVDAAMAAEPVFGSATGEMDEAGDLTPTGGGRFSIEDRVYAGRIVGRSVVDTWADCFTGALTSTEEWSLEASKYNGSHRSAVTIRSRLGVLTLRLRGEMDSLSASGTWEIVRATRGCSELEGEGQYTATYSSSGPSFRLTLEGEVGT